MKKTTLMLLTLFIFSCSSAQQLVRDPYQNRQLESMVVTRWGKFIPQWYYLLFHNKYRKGEDRRTMLQLLPTVAALSITEARSADEKEDSEQLYEQAFWVAINRTWQAHYHFYFKPRFEQINQDIHSLLLEAELAGVDPSVVEAFKGEQSRLNGQIDILRDGFLARGESTAGMQEIAGELTQLQGMIHRYLGHQHLMNHYVQP